MEEKYEAPMVSVLGSFGMLTLTDKCGSAPDALTPVLALDGSIFPEGGCTPT